MPVLGKGIGGGGALGGGGQVGQGQEIGGGEINPGGGGTLRDTGGIGSIETDANGVTKGIAIKFRFLSASSRSGEPIGRVISIPNFTRMTIATTATSHSSTSWQVRRLPQENIVYSFTTYANRLPSPNLAIINNSSLTNADLDLDRQFSWQLRFRENPEGQWSSWKDVDMSGKRRGVSRSHRNKYVETQGADGRISIVHTNPKTTATRGSDGRTIITRNDV